MQELWVLMNFTNLAYHYLLVEAVKKIRANKFIGTLNILLHKSRSIFSLDFFQIKVVKLIVISLGYFHFLHGTNPLKFMLHSMHHCKSARVVIAR